MEMLLPLALKVLGCAVAIYIIAGFLVSLTRLLPIFAILSSVGTIFSVFYIRGVENGQTLLWLPIALSLLTQLFYRGPEYMNPKIHENVYTFVTAERKWNSLFEDFDDYELHFTPLETGGFIENTLIFGIIFGLYFNALTFSNMESWVVLILPIYFLLMSVVDLLMSIGILRISAIFYGLLRIFIIIVSIAVGFLGPFGSFGSFGGSGGKGATANAERLYQQGKDISDIDFENTSYIAYYEWVYHTGYDSHIQEDYAYIYDADYDTGAEFRNLSAGRVFDILYTTLKGSDTVSKLNNIGGFDYEWMYLHPATRESGPFHYSSIELPEFSSYYTWSKDKVKEAHKFQKNKSERTYVIQYDSDYDSSYDKNAPHYRLSYTYNTDKDMNLVSLASVRCDLFVDEKNQHTLIYTPCYEGTGIEALFDNNDMLKGYTHSENVLYGIDFDQLMNNYNGVNQSLHDHDFKMTETFNGTSSLYVYDSSENIVAVYNENYDNGLKATENDDFETYKPDFYVSNTTKNLYDKDLNLIDEGDRSFKWWTFDNSEATHFLHYIFDSHFVGDIDVEEDIYRSWIVVHLTRPHDEFDGDISYDIHLSRTTNGTYVLQYIIARATYEGREYHIVVRTSSYHIEVTLPDAI